MPSAMVKAHEAVEVARGDDLLEHVRNLQSHALRILNQAERAGEVIRKLRQFVSKGETDRPGQ